MSPRDFSTTVILVSGSLLLALVTNGDCVRQLELQALHGLSEAPPGAVTLKSDAPRVAPVAPGGPAGVSLLAAAAQETDVARDIAASDVTVAHCYQADVVQTLCFSVFNGSQDAEWIDRVQLTFPTVDGNWLVSCVPALQDPTDSMGHTVNFACSAPLVNQIVFQDDDADGIGEISSGASWTACVEVDVPSGYDGNRFIPWLLEGDEGGSAGGSIEIEKCTPLTLTPSEFVLEGCNGLPQTLDFVLVNYGAGNVTVNMSYDSPDAAFSGPTSVFLLQGETLTFSAEFVPELALQAGQTIFADLGVEGGGYEDSSSVMLTITEAAGWRRRADSPVSTMDNVVVWASHRDGGLWSIGGYDADGAVQRFDPGADTWSTFQAETVLGSVIEYPMDGCYGLDGSNPDTAHEIVVLFPDTFLPEELHVYDITANTWSTRSIPSFFPPGFTGRWGFDVVSLLNNGSLRPGVINRNLCYLSGGSDQEGGGRARDLWVYDPATNSGQYLGNFAADVWFGFHASWYVPWVGDDGAICVAGGVDHNIQINNTTQCYDLATATFGGLNADLGTLPEPWWGMADGWQLTEIGHELWIANGVAQNGTLLPASAFIREGMVNFDYGPEMSESLYRTEGDSYGGRFFTLNGAQGGFSHSKVSLHLAPCPDCDLIFADGFESGGFSQWSSHFP